MREEKLAFYKAMPVPYVEKVKIESELQQLFEDNTFEKIISGGSRQVTAKKSKKRLANKDLRLL